MTRKHFFSLATLLFLLLCSSCTKEEFNEDALRGEWIVESSNETVVGFWGYSTFMQGDIVRFDLPDIVQITRPATKGGNQLVFDFTYRVNTRPENDSYLYIGVSQYYAADQTGLASFFISKYSRSSLHLNKVYNQQISDELVILKRSH